MDKTKIKQEYFVFSNYNQETCKKMYQFFADKCEYSLERVCILYTKNLKKYKSVQKAKNFQTLIYPRKIKY